MAAVRTFSVVGFVAVRDWRVKFNVMFCVLLVTLIVFMFIDGV